MAKAKNTCLTAIVIPSGVNPRQRKNAVEESLLIFRTIQERFLDFVPTKTAGTSLGMTGLW